MGRPRIPMRERPGWTDTTCPYGHLINKRNTYFDQAGCEMCRICRTNYVRQRYMRNGRVPIAKGGLGRVPTPERLCPTDRAWLAGVVDNRKCLSFSGRGTVRMHLPIHNKKVVEWLIDNVGGYYHTTAGWMLHGPEIAGLLRRLMPYLRVQQPKMMLMVDYCKTMRTRGMVDAPAGYTDVEHKHRAALRKKIEAL